MKMIIGNDEVIVDRADGSVTLEIPDVKCVSLSSPNARRLAAALLTAAREEEES